MLPHHQEILAQLPLLLNSSLEMKRVLAIALQHLKSSVNAEAATVFLLDETGNELIFWAMQGETSKKLENRRIPSNKGIVGWVIQNQKPELITDTSQDKRFFSDVDKQSGFQTRNLVCVPLTAGGKRPIGAIQVLNRIEGSFNSEDAAFLERFSHQLALALENARLFESLQEKSQRLATLEARKSEMISVISHEFRTPCGLIQTSVDLLASGMVTPETSDEVYQILLKGADRITQLVEQIRNLSFVSEGKIKAEMRTVKVQELFNSLSSFFEKPLSTRTLQFGAFIAPNVTTMNCDQSLIFLALKNLISNAIRFTPDGGQIVLSANMDIGSVNIMVQDTGMGIDESQHKLIMEKFYEVRNALHHESGQYKFNSGGLGLGLATVRSILQAHNSSLTIQSSLNQGSSFSFRLSA